MTKLALAALAASAMTLAACDSGSPPVENDEALNTAEEVEDLAIALGSFDLILPAVEGRPAAVYGEITGTGKTDRLTGILVDGTAIELHETIDEDGIMRMVPQEAFELPAGGTLSLAPGGKHGMTTGDMVLPAAGENVRLTLIFEDAGELAATASVRNRASMPVAS
ncbi:MAG: copper chaperone PCu(A)C, partial [Pacificimonas sp.]